jgi:hypothetical protein
MWRHRNARRPPPPACAATAATAVAPETVRLTLMPEHLKENSMCNIGAYKTLLSLDGGGMRGHMTAVVLQRLEDTIKQVIWDDSLIDKEKLPPGITPPAGCAALRNSCSSTSHALAGSPATPTAVVPWGRLLTSSCLPATAATASPPSPGQRSLTSGWETFSTCWQAHPRAA